MVMAATKMNAGKSFTEQKPHPDKQPREITQIGQDPFLETSLLPCRKDSPQNLSFSGHFVSESCTELLLLVCTTHLTLIETTRETALSYLSVMAQTTPSVKNLHFQPLLNSPLFPNPMMPHTGPKPTLSVQEQSLLKGHCLHKLFPDCPNPSQEFPTSAFLISGFMLESPGMCLKHASLHFQKSKLEVSAVICVGGAQAYRGYKVPPGDTSQQLM